jgi:hypothetical protein
MWPARPTAEASPESQGAPASRLGQSSASRHSGGRTRHGEAAKAERGRKSASSSARWNTCLAKWATSRSHSHGQPASAPPSGARFRDKSGSLRTIATGSMEELRSIESGEAPARKSSRVAQAFKRRAEGPSAGSGRSAGARGVRNPATILTDIILASVRSRPCHRPRW